MLANTKTSATMKAAELQFVVVVAESLPQVKTQTKTDPQQQS